MGGLRDLGRARSDASACVVGLTCAAALGGMVAVAASGCIRNTDDDAGRAPTAARPFHAAGTFVQGGAPWQWITPTKEFTTEFLASKGFPESALLPEAHVATIRMQAWLDRLIDSLAAKAAGDRTLREALASVPRPKVRITADPVLNAWVLGAPLCLEVAGRIGSVPPDATVAPRPDAHGTPRLTYDFKKRTFSGAFEKSTCPSSRAVAAKAYATWFNAKGLSCRLETEADALVVPESCFDGGQRPAWLSGGAAFRDIRITSTVPVIVFGKGMLERATEEAHAVGVLAHELGHVLKSHHTSEDSGYDFFYRHARRNPVGKPAPEPSVRVLGERLRDVSSDIMFFEVRGGRFDPSLFQRNMGFALGASNAPGCDGNAPCRKACGDLEAYVASTDFQPIVDSQSVPIFLGGNPVFPFAPLPDEQRAAFLRFEELVGACSALVPLPSGGDGDPASVYHSLAAGSPAYVDTHLRKVRGAIATRLDLLEAIGAAYDERDAERNALYAKALDEKLGFYTVEQEADELALEFLHAAGLSARSFPDFEMTLGLAKEQEGDPLHHDLDHARCAAYRMAGWKDESGVPARIPLGSVADPHHGSCYRVFNADREIERHGWDGRGRTHPTTQPMPAFEPPWDEIRKAL